MFALPGAERLDRIGVVATAIGSVNGQRRIGQLKRLGRRHLLQLGHDAGVVDFELVVDEQNAFIGDEGRRVAGDEVVVDDVEVVLDLDEIQLGGLLAKSLTVAVNHPQGGSDEGEKGKTGDGALWHAGKCT